jgi:hypothetical protein
MKNFRTLAIALAVVSVSSVASAQRVEGTRSGMPRVNLVSANPIGLLFEWYNGEFEHAMSPTVSLAVAGSHFGLDDSDYTSLDGIARYYPAGKALRGFSFGMSLGVVNVNDDADGSCFGCEDQDGTSATIGVRGDYVWILGRDQRFAVAAGIGAKRLLNNDLGTEGLPIGRLSIGYAW